MAETAEIHVDGFPFRADPTRNLLEVCLGLGFDLPYFCWHPAMGSVGACRQCAVKQYRDAEDRAGRIVMACMTPAADGTRLSIDDPEARDFRARVIEWLMVNHPHDCPVCEEGGECHLQDMTVLTGHNYRRYRFTKRTHRNQYLGPFINHEMNRCIACYRCVRFYRDYAGGEDLNVFGCHDGVYFGRETDGVLEDPFSGNLVEICPTGVFTDKPLSDSYTRKWDLRSAPSVCPHCAVGCNTSPGERYGRLKRIQNRYNADVNGYFLCDRGRFGPHFVNNDTARIRRPALRRDGDPAVVNPLSAARRAHELLAHGDAVGIGSPRASLEANFALRQLVGRERFCSGLSARDHRAVALVMDILRRGPAPAASVADAEQADAVLVLGDDPTVTMPRIALALRQAVRQHARRTAVDMRIPDWHDAAIRNITWLASNPLYLVTTGPARLDDIATGTCRAAPADVARLGHAVAHALDAEAPEVDGLDEDRRRLVSDIAEALKGAERPLVVAGPAAGGPDVMRAAANVAWALSGKGRPARIALGLPEANTMGVGLLGGEDVDTALERLAQSGAEALVVVENDLYRRADRSRVDAALDRVGGLIVIDSVRTPTADRADVLLPSGTFAESDGTLVSYEGRAQRYFQVFEPEDDTVRESWRWLDAIGDGEVRGRLDDFTRACAEAVPALRRITEAAPGADFRIAGRKMARAPHRYSGRTAMRAHVDVSEPKPPEDPDSALSFTMEGYYGRREPGALRPFFWAPSWNSIQAVNKFQDEIGGPQHGGEPGVRLLDPASARPGYFTELPAPFRPPSGEWVLASRPEIFGSDELSALSPPVAERVPEPYAVLHPDDARGIGLADGARAELSAPGYAARLRLRLDPGLPRGVVGVPAGLPGLPPGEPPARVRIQEAGS